MDPVNPLLGSNFVVNCIGGSPLASKMEPSWAKMEQSRRLGGAPPPPVQKMQKSAEQKHNLGETLAEYRYSLLLPNSKT